MASNEVKFGKRPPKRDRRQSRGSPARRIPFERILLPILFVAALALAGISFKFVGPDVKESSASPLSTWQITSVHDGDTFRIGSERIRILGMDAPEIGKRAQCQKEQRDAQSARDYLRQKLTSNNIKIKRSGKDVYGRTLATVFVDGRNIADEMIKLGLAIPYSPSTHGEWCNLMNN